MEGIGSSPRQILPEYLPTGIEESENMSRQSVFVLRFKSDISRISGTSDIRIFLPCRYSEKCINLFAITLKHGNHRPM
jgi:hypothetical protein